MVPISHTIHDGIADSQLKDLMSISDDISDISCFHSHRYHVDGSLTKPIYLEV